MILTLLLLSIVCGRAYGTASDIAQGEGEGKKDGAGEMWLFLVMRIVLVLFPSFPWYSFVTFDRVSRIASSRVEQDSNIGRRTHVAAQDGDAGRANGRDRASH